MNPYEVGLDRGRSSYVPLTPASFLARSAAVYPKKPAVIHGDQTFTCAEFSARSRLLASALAPRKIPVIHIEDPLYAGDGGRKPLGEKDYEGFLQKGDPEFDWQGPADEWQAICLLYTSGTTGNPKGVVYSHRGAYLNALGNALTFGVSARSVYLWYAAHVPLLRLDLHRPWGRSCSAGTP